jgi:hypothetical protein
MVVRWWTGALVGAVLLGTAPDAAAQIGPDLAFDAELRDGATRSCRADVTPPAPNTRPAVDAVKVLPPEGRPYVGAYQIPAHRPDIEAFAGSLGGSPPLVFSFHDWYAESNGGEVPDQGFDDPLEGENGVPPLVLADRLAEEGAVLALSWSIYCCDIYSTRFWFRLKRPYDHFQRIIDGADDAFIRRTARMIKEFGRPIMLTLVPEMNWQGQYAFGADGRGRMAAVDDICGLYGDPAWPDGPERIRDLYIHVIDLFRQEGADNVTWFMYSANRYMADVMEESKWLHPRFYYPGDAYIDWVGQSVYFIDPDWEVDFEETGSFEEVFGPGYAAWRSVTSRPLFLPEFGILAEPERDRTELWRRTFETFLPAKPGVSAITIADSLLFELYFDLPRVSGRGAESEALRRLLDEGGYTRRLRIGTPAMR